MAGINRRSFLQSTAGVATAALVPQLANTALCHAEPMSVARGAKMRFGLVTYMWGFDWDIPTILKNCEKARAMGVELRTQHAHGVEPEITVARRQEVKKQFADSPITLVGVGCNECFHQTDTSTLKASIERAKAFIKLSHDIGGTGAKVKPNDLPKEVSHEKTIEQIGKALNELGVYAADYNQQVRLEVHGQCAALPTIASIMQVADHPNVAVCWNSNQLDLQGEGLEHNFQLVEKRLGATTHVRELDADHYPYSKLINLLKRVRYSGWLLIEAGDRPPDRVAALAKQRAAFDSLVGA